jgi:hypothetical protein
VTAEKKEEGAPLRWSAERLRREYELREAERQKNAWRNKNFESTIARGMLLRLSDDSGWEVEELERELGVEI